MVDGGWMHGWGWLWACLFGFGGIALLAVLVVALVRAAATAARPSGARAILDERLARGDIEDDEYRRLRSTLQS